MSTIEYYFWINSDWAYLGADRLEALARRHDATILYKPVDLLDVYARTGGIPLPQRSPNAKRFVRRNWNAWLRVLVFPTTLRRGLSVPKGNWLSPFPMLPNFSASP